MVRDPVIILHGFHDDSPYGYRDTGQEEDVQDVAESVDDYVKRDVTIKLSSKIRSFDCHLENKDKAKVSQDFWLIPHSQTHCVLQFESTVAQKWTNNLSGNCVCSSSRYWPITHWRRHNWRVSETRSLKLAWPPNSAHLDTVLISELSASALTTLLSYQQVRRTSKFGTGCYFSIDCGEDKDLTSDKKSPTSSSEFSLTCVCDNA